MVKVEMGSDKEEDEQHVQDCTLTASSRQNSKFCVDIIKPRPHKWSGLAPMVFGRLQSDRRNS